MKHEIITTNDGSKTIYLPELDETYHSSHGAVQEAIHVFIQYGLRALPQQEVRVFEMGFGTGLNALLTGIEAKNTGRTIHYVGIEAYPVAMETAKAMDYTNLVGAKHDALFESIHSSDWEKPVAVDDTFSVHKIHAKIEDYTAEVKTFDIVYYDAFGPRAQEAMWASEILEKMFQMLKVGGCLVTYCAKGQVKRDLKALGFEIEPLPGPPGKREMTRAWKR